MFAYINEFNKLGSLIPGLYNWTLSNSVVSGGIKKLLHVASARSLPTIANQSLAKWYKKEYPRLPQLNNPIKTVYFFNDEFTNWNDTEIGIKAIKLLHGLHYKVVLIEHPESGRAAISKGLLHRAKKLAEENVNLFSTLIDEDHVLVGIEPSCLLSFRDEYPRLVNPSLKEKAEHLKANSYLIEEFLAREVELKNIRQESFDTTQRTIKLHGHCHQKALSNIEDAIWALSLPKNNSVELIPSGCCGMAGSFGYEREHFEVSQQIGELVLFPAVRASTDSTIIAASGTSCRHQIWDGTSRKAVHPVEILYDSLMT